MTGLFLSLEGGEGSGKTTQARALAGRIEAVGLRAVVTREPGGTPLGARLRELLVRETDDPPGAVAELLLYAADRAHHVARVIRPALESGAVVICDRYADATEAYQGWGRGVPLEVVRAINRTATGGLVPHRTVLLDTPPPVGLGRAWARHRARGGPPEERFESEALAFHERVRAGYREIARSCPERLRVVDATNEPRTVTERVWEAVADLFAS